MRLHWSQASEGAVKVLIGRFTEGFSWGANLLWYKQEGGAFKCLFRLVTFFRHNLQPRGSLHLHFCSFLFCLVVNHVSTWAINNRLLCIYSTLTSCLLSRLDSMEYTHSYYLTFWNLILVLFEPLKCFHFCVKYEIVMAICHVYIEGVGGEIQRMTFGLICSHVRARCHSCHQLVNCGLSGVTDGKQSCVASSQWSVHGGSIWLSIWVLAHRRK